MDGVFTDLDKRPTERPSFINEVCWKLQCPWRAVLAFFCSWVGQGWSLTSSKKLSSENVGSLKLSCNRDWSFPCFTFKTHPRHEASPQSTRGAVFPPQLVDGAVVAAGTQVVLFTWWHNRSPESWQQPVLTHTHTPAPHPPADLFRATCLYW